MDLLIDSGNSRLKWVRLDQRRLDSGGACRGGEHLSPAVLERFWGDLPKPDRIWVANVAGKKVESFLRSWMESRWGIIPRFVRSQVRGFGVISGYRQPEQLGVDRWLALVAVRRHFPLPACIIDCGTALTLDLLDADGCHHGGLICPGRQLMVQALDQGTADVRMGACAALDGLLADHTAAAVALGVHEALLGLVERSLRRLADRWPSLHVILTGGDASELASRLAVPSVQVVPDLVLRGLALVSRES